MQRWWRRANGPAAADCNCSGQMPTPASTWPPSTCRQICGSSTTAAWPYGRTGSPYSPNSPPRSGLAWRFDPAAGKSQIMSAWYYLPRDEEGHQQYSTAEGVSWLDDDHLVVVSDRAPEGPLPDEASEGTSLRASLIGSDRQPRSAETIRFRKAVASRWLSASTPSQ